MLTQWHHVASGSAEPEAKGLVVEMDCPDQARPIEESVLDNAILIILNTLQQSATCECMDLN